jgi:competence protein ComEC
MPRFAVRIGCVLLSERDRWILWLPVAFGSGVAVYFLFPYEPPAWLGITGLSVVAVVGLVGRSRPWLVVAALALGAACGGFAVAQWRTAQVAAPVIAKRTGPVEITGQIRDLSLQPSGVRMVLQHLQIPGLSAEATPSRVRVRAAGESTAKLEPGDWVHLRAVLQPPPAPAAPGAYDFARQAYFQRIGAVGFTVSRVRPLLAATAAEREAPKSSWQVFWAGWHLFWGDLRKAMAERVTAALPGTSGGVAAALMTGERGAIPKEVTTAMRDSGLAHLLAISGLHMGLVAGLLFFGLRGALALSPFVALRFPIKKWAAVAAAFASFGYLQLVGAPIPTQRAFAMVLLVLLAVLLDRTAISLRLVCWAALAVLVIAPESLLSASFQMSFAAVTALVAGYEAISARGLFFARDGGGTFGGKSPGAIGQPWVRRVGFYLAGVCLTSVIAILATAPFAVYHFNRIAWFGLAANLVAVPSTALWVMPWAIVAFMLMPLGLEELALIPMGWGLDVVIAVAQGVAAWPGAVMPVAALPPAGLGLVAIGGLWLCIWRRPWRIVGLALVLLGLASLVTVRPPDVLASGDGKLLGIRGDGGELLVSSARTARYTAGAWARRNGVAEAMAWPLDQPAAGGRLTCDSLGCIYRANGQVVALVQDSRALMEDCRLATVVVSLEPVRRGTCPGPSVVIDRFDLWRNGGYALWLWPDGVRVRNASETRGLRPWVLDRRPEWERDKE